MYLADVMGGAAREVRRIVRAETPIHGRLRDTFVVVGVVTGGRILDVFMELYAVTVVATLAGSVGSFMVRRGHERERASASAAAG